jgi:hypothetical protein
LCLHNPKHPTEAQVRPLVRATPRFIQLVVPLLPLKPMDQSRRGATHAMEAQVRPMTMALPEGALVPP